MSRIRILLALLPLLLTTGCWSKVEIDEQTFILPYTSIRGKLPIR